MGITDIFSTRKKKLEKNIPDVYQYDTIPQPFRIQIAHIWISIPGEPEAPNILRDYPSAQSDFWFRVQNALAREYGVFRLSDKSINPFHDCVNFLQETQTDGVLDIIEVSLRLLQTHWQKNFPPSTQSINEAIEELNSRFQEHSIGYEYTNHQIIRIDSKYLHKETVKPALGLLFDKKFQGALEEFESAHEHYRHGRHKEAVASALKSFESTMKIIFKLRGWAFKPTDAANKLLQVVFDKNLIPAYLTNHFTGLRAILEGGVPTVRNKTSGHGQGDELVEVPDYLAAYILHTTAANIVLLIEAHNHT